MIRSACDELCGASRSCTLPFSIETAEREGISPEELVREAVEQRINGRGFRELYSIARRNADRTGLRSDDIEAVVESEIAAHRNERSR